MLEKPGIQEAQISAWLETAYGLPQAQVTFLPIGADLKTAVYRVATNDQLYFLKLRMGVFDETSVALPQTVHEQGIPHILPPLMTASGDQWATMAEFTVILYPYIDGHNGYEADLPDGQWVELGQSLRAIHAFELPKGLRETIREEDYSPQWRQTLISFLNRLEAQPSVDTVAEEMAIFLKEKAKPIRDLVRQADERSRILQSQPPAPVLCHGDIHAGNILIADDTFFIVDWDDPVLAPKERDLMVAGGGLMGGWRSPLEEENLFYQGYGPTTIDSTALTYYRCERIIQDLAIYCQQIFLTGAGGDDREQALTYLKANFLPGGTLELATQSDRRPGRS